MKKLFRMISVYLAAIVLLGAAVGCSQAAPTEKLPKLLMPAVTIDDSGVASWEEVENAVYYAYVIDEGEEHLTFELHVQEPLNHNESIKVKAVSGSEAYADSEYSRYKTYIKEIVVDDKTKLATPTVAIDADGVAIWSVVSHAGSYVYVIDDGEEKTTTVRTVTLENNQSIKVKAVAGSDEYTDSDFSATKTYVKSAVQTKLATPTVTINSDGVASWSAVSYADSYVYVIDGGAEKSTTALTVTLENNQSIKVKAIGGSSEYIDSDFSATKTYVKVVIPNLSTDVQKYYSGITATSGDALLGQVHDLITTTHTYYSSYDDCKNTKYVYLTDPGPNGGALEFYTQQSIMSFSGNPGTWNREHVWCKSLSNGMWTSVSGGTRNGGTDLHHIRPAEGSLNSTRGSYKFGKADGGKEAWSKDTSNKNVAVGGHISGSTFEPLDKVKGDVARIVFYVYTHYNTYANVHGTTNGSGGAFGTLKFNNIVSLAEPAAIKLLLEWNAADPVDQIEITRNNEVYKIQGNRNPFIDHPEYANAIWG